MLNLSDECLVAKRWTLPKEIWGTRKGNKTMMFRTKMELGD